MEAPASDRVGAASRKLAETPTLLKTPAGFVQPSPWLAIANKQIELMAKFMAELGPTPSARSRLAIQIPGGRKPWEFDLDEDDPAGEFLNRTQAGAPVGLRLLGLA